MGEEFTSWWTTKNSPPLFTRSVGTQDPSFQAWRHSIKNMSGELDIKFPPHSRHLEVICLVIVMIPLEQSTTNWHFLPHHVPGGWQKTGDKLWPWQLCSLLNSSVAVAFPCCCHPHSWKQPPVCKSPRLSGAKVAWACSQVGPFQKKQNLFWNESVSCHTDPRKQSLTHGMILGWLPGYILTLDCNQE